MTDLQRILTDASIQEGLRTLEEILQPVGTGPYPTRPEPASLPFGTGAPEIRLFQQDLQVSAAGALTAQIHGADAPVDNLFGTGETERAPAGQSFSLVGLDLTAEVGNRSALATEPLSLTFTGSASTGFQYQHLFPVSQTVERLEALRQNLRAARLPSALDPRELTAGEVHRFEAHFNLDLGLKLTWGYARDFSRTFENLFEGLSPTVQAQATASLEAALGWSLHEAFLGVLGRSQLLNEDWARLRLQRSRQSRLSFGAVVTLEVNYNLADALDSILRRALDLTPLPRVVGALEEVARLGSAEALRDRLSERATDAIADYLDDTGWREKLDDSAFVTRLVHTAQEVVSTYDGLSDQVQSWWDDLLGRVALEPGSAARRVLERLERLDSDTLDLSTLLDPDKRNTVEILEALSGRSLEDLLLGQNDEFRAVLQQVGARAREALDFLSRLDDLPGEVLQRLQGFAARTGIDDVLDFLSQNASSKAQLEAAIATQARNTVRSLVGRLTGKLFHEVTDEEVQQLQRWAQSLLDSYEELRGRVDEAIEKTRGRFGFSLSLAVDRATRRQAWIDVEFDPTKDRVRNIIRRSLERGSPRVLLEELAMAGADDGTTPAFQIREAVFSFRRNRSAAVLLSSLGTQVLGTRGERIDEYHIRLEQPAPGAPLEREARFSGGYLRTQISGSAEVHCAAWLDATTQDAVTAPEDPFRHMQHGVRLTLGWNDPATTSAQVTALGVILADLGFPPLPPAAEGAVARGANGVPTRFALELRLPAAAVPALVALPPGKEGEEGWNEDYLRAGRRWYAETLNPDLLHPPAGPSIGAILGWVLRHPDFLRRWTEGVNAFTDWARENDAFGRLRRTDVTLVRHPQRPNRIAQWFSPYNSLAYFLVHRGEGKASVADLAAAFEAAEAEPTPERLARQTRLAANALRRVFATAPLDSSSWTNPMFHFWWILARLARVAPQELQAVRGLYSLRWKGSSDTDAWQDPVMAQLEAGINPKILEDAFRA